MRILFVNRMASILRGGGETFDLEMAKVLERLGAEVTFLTGLPRFGGARCPVEHPRAFTVRSPYFGDVNWDRFRGGWRIRQLDFRWFEKKAMAWAESRMETFDILQICELPRLVADWKQRGHEKPVVMRMTSPLYHDPVGGIQKADALIASGTTMETMRKGVREDCVDIPNGVDVERFKPGPTDFRKTAGIGEDDLVVLFVARLIPVKNHAMLIESFKRLTGSFPSARLVLVGDGMLRDGLMRLCRQLSLNQQVLFLGDVPFEQVPDIYRAADIKVISSHYESFSFTTLEGMASGLPLVVTETQWVPRLVGHEEGGLVVPPDHAGAFAEALERLAGDRALREHMGRRNREVVARDYGWEESGRKLMDLYRNLIEAER